MRGSQKGSTKEFTMSQYYNQLEKYQTGISATQKPALRKDYSLHNFSKDAAKTSNFSKTYKQPLKQQKIRLGIVDSFASKTSFERIDKKKLENLKKYSMPADNVRGNSYMGDSLTGSSVTYNHWNQESRLAEKENIPFSATDHQIFVSHCSKLYDLKGQEPIVDEIVKQINKRDEVYEVISEHFGSQTEESYCQKLKNHLSEGELMKKIIEQFKTISKLQITDLNELYYFLKSDH